MKSMPPLPPFPEAFTYASYVEGRRPKYKLHRIEAHMKSALRDYGGVGYQLIDGKCQVIADKRPNLTCVQCLEAIPSIRQAFISESSGRLLEMEDRRFMHYYCKYPNQQRPHTPEAG